MKSEYLAKEAERLKADPIFIRALDDIRAETLAELALANADDKTTILRLQQRVAVVNEIRAVLDRYIVASEGPEQEAASPYA